MRAHPRGSGALGCLGQTAARRSLSGSRILRASEVPGCKSVGITGGNVESVREKTDSRTAENITTKKKNTLTLKHSSVTKSLAMEQRETASGLFSCSAVAASRTSRRDATRLVAISASLNCRYCKTQWGTQSVVERATDLLQKKKKKKGRQNKISASPGCWRASLQTASGPTCDLLLAARWRAPLPGNRTLWAERVRIGRRLKSEEDRGRHAYTMLAETILYKQCFITEAFMWQ